MAQESAGHSLVESYASGSFKTAIKALARSSEGSTGGRVIFQTQVGVSRIQVLVGCQAEGLGFLLAVSWKDDRER